MKSIMAFLFIMILSITAINNQILIAQTNSQWPSFHGSDRQNKSNETGLLKTWPVDGPELAFTISGLGDGYSSVAIAAGLLYTSGKADNLTYVYAYDLTGKLVWKQPNGSSWDVKVSWASSYNGSRGTPTYDNGLVYHLSEAGRLTAFNSKTGTEIWSKEFTTDFKAEIPDYGFSESILIDGNNLFVKPAGQVGFLLCLNKMTGETQWVTNGISGTYAYNSLIIKDFGGYHQVIGASSNSYYGIDSKTGVLLWEIDFENKYSVNCNDAIPYNEYIFVSGGQGGGSMLIKLSSSGNSITAESVWHSQLMDNYYGGILLHDGYIYGTGNTARSWFCLDLMTGKQMWKSTGIGSLTYAEGMLYMYDEKGTIKLIKATPEAYEEKGEFKVPSGGTGAYWAHPVVCGGRLYLRHADKLFAYNISSK